MDIILLFLAKPLDKHGTTLMHITYPPLKTSKTIGKLNVTGNQNGSMVPEKYKNVH